MHVGHVSASVSRGPLVITPRGLGLGLALAQLCRRLEMTLLPRIGDQDKSEEIATKIHIQSNVLTRMYVHMPRGVHTQATKVAGLQPHKFIEDQELKLEYKMIK